MMVEADGDDGRGGVGGWLQGVTIVPKAAESGVVDVAAGRDHSMALLETGEVLVWGRGDSLAVPPAIQKRTVAISAGLAHSLALLDNGTVVAWGYDAQTQADVPPAARQYVVAVMGGTAHSLALLASGEVVAWGTDKLGLTNVPEVAKSNIVAIAASIYYSVALLNNGTAVSWGAEAREQLMRIPAAAMADVAAVATRAAHTLAIVLPPPYHQGEFAYFVCNHSLPKHRQLTCHSSSCHRHHDIDTTTHHIAIQTFLNISQACLLCKQPCHATLAQEV